MWLKLSERTISSGQTYPTINQIPPLHFQDAQCTRQISETNRIRCGWLLDVSACTLSTYVITNVPSPVRSGLSGGSQNTTSVRQARKMHGRVSMYVDRTRFRRIFRWNLSMTKLGCSCSEGTTVRSAATWTISQPHDSWAQIITGALIMVCTCVSISSYIMYSCVCYVIDVIYLLNIFISIFI